MYSHDCLILIFDLSAGDATGWESWTDVDSFDGAISDIIVNTPTMWGIGARTLLVFGNTMLVYGHSKKDLYMLLRNNFPNLHFVLFESRGLTGVITPEMHAFLMEEGEIDDFSSRLLFNQEVTIKRKP